MKYLYTAWLASFGTCETRRRKLVEMGRDVVAVSFTPDIERLGRRVGNLQQKIGFGPGIRAYNQRLLRLATQHQPDIVWIDKGTLVQAPTLREIKRRTGALLVHYNTDDLEFARHYWKLHLEGIAEYDCYFTTNAANVDQIRRLGARTVIQTALGYDKDVFAPLRVSDEDTSRLGAEIGFVGSWEPAKERWLAALVAAGLPLRVFGTMWQNATSPELSAAIGTPGPVVGNEYVKAINCTKVNIGLVSAQNRSQSSGRSFEIPACGAFLLALRTPEHQSFYDEGKEIECFGSVDELASKALHYLNCTDTRLAIAKAGRERCVRSGYSWQDRMAGMVETVETMVRART
jgi:glycosyltransferase involved in cell wall biosynthesis